MDNENKSKSAWAELVAECERQYEIKQKRRRESSITGSWLTDALLFEALWKSNDRDRDDDRKRRR